MATRAEGGVPGGGSLRLDQIVALLLITRREQLAEILNVLLKVRDVGGQVVLCREVNEDAKRVREYRFREGEGMSNFKRGLFVCRT